MSDLFYHLVVTVGRFPFWVSSRPVILHLDRVPREGAFILAANHVAPYDVAVLMRHTGRVLDFVSTTEVMGTPVVGGLYRRMGAYPLDRGRVDVGATKWVVDRLRRGRVVAMFPEGRIRPEAESVVFGGSFRPGVLELARLAGVPIVPAVVWGTSAYGRAGAWMPGRGVRYGINYGEGIMAGEDAGERLVAAWRALHGELMGKMALRDGKV